VAILGFLGVMALSALSARQGGATQPPVTTSAADDDDDDDDYDEDKDKPRTPMKTPPRKSKKPTATGLVMTPSGRRSARLAHKED
jgi:hypothetical protein